MMKFLYVLLPMALSKKVAPIAKNTLYFPKTANQRSYVQYLESPIVNIAVATGPAGCGKTLFACQTAIQKLKMNEIDRIICTRPTIAVEDENLGFLPGNIISKMEPWTQPIMDVFTEYYSKQEVQAMIKTGMIEIIPLAFMRGRTFKRTFILADEMQNSTPHQMLMLTTRLGEHSKLVITGDLQQTDRTGINGLQNFIEKWQQYQKTADSIEIFEHGNHSDVSPIKIVQFHPLDVQRSSIVSLILRMEEEFPSSRTYMMSPE